jgi:Family of unknown function (DUF5522)
LKLGLDYIIENDKWVFTRHFLLKRGYCCKNNCRNCPYDDDKNQNNTNSIIMATDLYLNTNAKAKPALVQSDDLVFDGEKIIIPGYWSEALADFLAHTDKNKLDEADRPDLETIREFLSKVVDYQQEKSTSGN